ncbi:HAMP domain-containing sensor histidine kinase [Clostridium brassicae]|uniref:histidine kinase n=1 Tax=Clostridium brassicae TaxID=2999072 RepID=A0ABT4D579_9CLOT|nr:histidine kinase dimerization/phospho-acceptor domain-containing protein [Clostridium brassicae]MCY6957432.1 ATP-binding protein [Clostridium brassicae]
MNRKGITYKLFKITLLTFIFTITLILLVQGLFFKRFYVLTKERFIGKNLDIIQDTYGNYICSNYGSDVLFKYRVDKYEKSNDVYICVLGDNLKNIQFESPSFHAKFGKYGADDLKNKLKSNLKNPSILTPVGYPYISIKITSLGDVKTEFFVIVKSVSAPKGPHYLAVVHPLQPISEVMSISKEYYLIIYAIAIIIIISISFIYSKLISRPLLELNTVASKMSKLNFKTKCKIKSNDDELGALGNSLNFLSENLDTALTSLKLANEKLQQDIDKERELENMRKEFVADASHELKTPISLIKGYSEGIKDGIAKGNKQDNYLDIIIDECDKMNILVNEMLDLSKLEFGKIGLNIETFYLDYLIEKILNKHIDLIEQKNIILEIDILKNLLVFGDEFRIEGVITNFLTNAISYTSENHIIKITTYRFSNEIMVEFENEGEHIANEELSRIWEKFYRIEKSRDKKLGGTGLGLAICKNILSLHKSNFGVENTQTGVKFFFTLNISE